MKNFEQITVDPGQMGGVSCVRHVLISRDRSAIVGERLSGGRDPILGRKIFVGACGSPLSLTRNQRQADLLV